jgi:Inorganic pyrophosphatase
LPFDEPPDQFTPEAQPAQQPMHQYEGKTSQGCWHEWACAHDYPAKNGPEHDHDDIVKGGAFAESTDPCDPDQDKGNEEGEDGPADHLQAIEVLSCSKKHMDQVHKLAFSNTIPQILARFFNDNLSDANKQMIRNDRFLAVPKCSNIFEKVKAMSDLPKQIMDQLEDFFKEYNKLEGKKFKAIEKMDPKTAQRLIDNNKNN